MSAKTKKAEEILKQMKKRDDKASKPYHGPPDIDFLVQQTTEGTGDRGQEKISRTLKELNESTMDDVGPLTSLSGIIPGYR